MSLLRHTPNTRVKVMNDRTEEFVDAEADDDGIVRNDQGHAFSAGAYSIVGEIADAR